MMPLSFERSRELREAIRQTRRRHLPAGGWCLSFLEHEHAAAERRLCAAWQEIQDYETEARRILEDCAEARHDIISRALAEGISVSEKNFPSIPREVDIE